MWLPSKEAARRVGARGWLSACEWTHSGGSVAAMTIRLHYFDAGNAFGDRLAEIRDALGEAKAHVEERSALREVDVVVQPLDFGHDQFPISAFTAGPHNVHIGIERSQIDSDQLEPDLFRTAVHELHHALRWRHSGPSWSVCEVIVLEGLAILADHAAAGPDGQTDRPLDDPGAALARLQEIRQEPVEGHRRWLYSPEDSQPGGPERVYSLGSMVMRAALGSLDLDPWQAGERSAEDLVAEGLSALNAQAPSRARAS